MMVARLVENGASSGAGNLAAGTEADTLARGARHVG